MTTSNCRCLTCDTDVRKWCKFYLEICDEGNNCKDCEDPMEGCTMEPDKHWLSKKE